MTKSDVSKKKKKKEIRHEKKNEKTAEGGRGPKSSYSGREPTWVCAMGGVGPERHQYRAHADAHKLTGNLISHLPYIIVVHTIQVAWWVVLVFHFLPTPAPGLHDSRALVAMGHVANKQLGGTGEGITKSQRSLSIR